MASQLHTATRQQLDELDELLQKMLDPPGGAPAPVPPRDKPVPPPPTPPKFPPAEVAYGIPPAVAFAADATVATPTSNEPTPRWDIDLNPRSGSSVLGGRSPLAEKLAAMTQSPPKPEVERPGPASLLRVTTIPTPTVQGSEPIEMPAVPLLLRPLSNINHRFEAMMQSFGPVGRITLQPTGRTVLGYAGMTMCAVSALWGYMAWAGWSW